MDRSWSIKRQGRITRSENQLIIEVTNVWANRLIGDEQEPSDCDWIRLYQRRLLVKEFRIGFLKRHVRQNENIALLPGIILLKIHHWFLRIVRTS